MSRVLFIVPLPPPIHGASLRNASLVNSEEIQSQFEIRVIAMRFISDNSEMGKFSLSKIWKALVLYLNMCKEILSFKPDLVYFNSATFGFALYRDLVVIFLAKLFRSNLIIHLRTQGVERQTKESTWKKFLFSRAFRKTTLICLSENLAKDVSSVYENDPIVVNNGIEGVGFPDRLYSSKKIQFLFLSNFLKTKGIFELVDAAEQLKNEAFDFRLVIAGKDADLSYQDINEYVISKNLEGLVTVLGPVYGKEKEILFKESDVFVFPTTFEAFPGVVLEAMQFGLPVISTIEGAIPEIIVDGTTGLLIKKKELGELIAVMKFFILNPEEVEKYGKSGMKRFQEKYTLDRFVERMITVFNQSIER